ncbi:ATP-binding protein [Streptomyces sp. NPDC050610]|uniref:ATP-binding protein n=1 Tax=Streptomyces sp. NPDC050610 TaxID=3157097 RepID=UPI00342986B7
MAYSYDAVSLRRRGGSSVQHLQDAFHLPARNTSVAEARRRVLARLGEWGVAQVVCEDAELVVSELFTNAVRHTDSDKVSCRLHVSGDRLHVEVADQGYGPDQPRARLSGADEESGRGLLLVGAVSDAWGVRPGEIGRGRVVWAVLAGARPGH